MWNSGWDDVYRDKEWGKYPPEEVIRFVGRNYFNAPDRTAVRFLEVGCGPGANLLFLAREGFSVHGIDGSAVALKRAKARLASEGLAAELTQGDAMNLSFENDVFDCILDVECMYANTLADSRRIIAEAHRTLKHGGRFFSKTFMTGTSGEKTGTRVEGEPNTFLEITDGPFNKGYGIIRLTAEDEIADLYGIFKTIEYDMVIRTDLNRNSWIKEWLISCIK